MGFVYIMRNAAHAHLVKVGFTNGTIEDRLRKLNTTGVPGRHANVYWCRVEDAQYLERLTHAALRDYRYSPRGEFFKISAAFARQEIRQAASSEGLRIRAQWSHPSVDAEDFAFRRRVLLAEIAQLERERDGQYVLCRTSNPFRRAQVVQATQRIRKLNDEIESRQAQLTILSGDR